MNSLLPSSATGLERALEQASRHQLGDIPLPYNDLLSPDRCPVALLPWLAWANSVDVWRNEWPEEVKRQVIRNAPEIHRKKGTVAAIKKAVESLGAGIAVIEWFEKTPPGPAHTFEVIYTPSAALPNTAEFQADVNASIVAANRLSAQFSLIASIAIKGELAITGAVRAVKYKRIQAEE